MAHGLTLGSLFDGSGGFPLAGLLSGIRPVWASEIEPFPIRVTTKRLPDMKHYGDVSKIDGGKIEPVDIITFGSPCQDLSVAGKREGIEQGQRSSLFFEAIRIIKEMRGATNGRYPTFIVWENVPGALSSGGGQDFRRVLEEVCGIKEADVSISRPAKWSNAGEIVGDGFSVAWRMLDAQYWGVPQRRKRIYLVGDLAGERAGKILFESEGVRGYSPQNIKAWKRTTADTEASVRAASEVVAQPVIAFDRAACNQGQNAKYDFSVQAELAQTILAQGPGGVCAPMNKSVMGIDLYNASITGDVSKTLNSAATDSDHTPCVIDTPKTLKIRAGCAGGGKGALIQEDKSATLGCNNDQTLFVPCAWDGSQTSPTITAHNANGSQRMPDKEHFNCVIQTSDISACGATGESMETKLFYAHGQKADWHGPVDVSQTVAHAFGAGGGNSPLAMQSLAYDARGNGDGEIVNTITGDHNDRITDYTTICKQGYIVRRLTPTECARLQGFPDWWCADLDTEEPTEEDVAFWRDVFETHRRIVTQSSKPKSDAQIIKWLKHPHSDSAEYKMWGNGVALPCVYYVMQGIASIMNEEV